MTPGIPEPARGTLHILLVGMMGSGKTSVGRLLAGDGAAFLDTDELIEKRAGRPVREIFASDGEPAFRALEEEVVAACLAADGRSIVATGGGAVESAVTRGRVNTERDTGRVLVVWLRAEPAELAARVGASTGRPLLDGDAAGRLRELGIARAANYAAVADLAVDTDGLTAAEVADRVRASVDSPYKDETDAGGTDSRRAADG